MMRLARGLALVACAAALAPPRAVRMSVSAPASAWAQARLTVTAPKRGCHLITGDVERAIGPELRTFRVGLCHVFVRHTSCSLTINENCDPTVRDDMERALNRLVPVGWNRDGTFFHTDEGDDDMPAHVKSSMLGVSLSIPVVDGRLALGTWQGIYLCEHRDQGGYGGGHRRELVVTVQGEPAKMRVSAHDPSVTYPDPDP